MRTVTLTCRLHSPVVSAGATPLGSWDGTGSRKLVREAQVADEAPTVDAEWDHVALSADEAVDTYAFLIGKGYVDNGSV